MSHKTERDQAGTALVAFTVLKGATHTTGEKKLLILLICERYDLQ